MSEVIEKMTDEQRRIRAAKIGAAAYWAKYPERRHGLRATREYHIWSEMIQRCTNPNNQAWPRYGARGIKVCDRWRSFTGFLEDMGQCPSGLQIDRIDNDGDYEPGNCHWVTPRQQAGNTRRNRWITYKGSSKILAEWAEFRGMRRGKLLYRLDHGWTVGQALGFETPPETAKHGTSAVLKAMEEKRCLTPPRR